MHTPPRPLWQEWLGFLLYTGTFLLLAALAWFAIGFGFITIIFVCFAHHAITAWYTETLPALKDERRWRQEMLDEPLSELPQSPAPPPVLRSIRRPVPPARVARRRDLSRFE